MIVRSLRRPRIRAISSVVVPASMITVSPSRTRSAAAFAMRRFGLDVGYGAVAVGLVAGDLIYEQRPPMSSPQKSLCFELREITPHGRDGDAEKLRQSLNVHEPMGMHLLKEADLPLRR